MDNPLIVGKLQRFGDLFEQRSRLLKSEGVIDKKVT